MLVALGIWMATKEGWFGYLFATIFAVNMSMETVSLFPGNRLLSLSKDGVAITTMFFGRKISWDIIDRFFVISVGPACFPRCNFIAFDMLPPVRTGLRYINWKIARCDGFLAETYGKTPKELADLLNTYRQTFSGKNGEQVAEPELPITGS